MRWCACVCNWLCVSAVHESKRRTSSALASADAPSAPISLLFMSSEVSAWFVCATREAASQRDRAADEARRGRHEAETKRITKEAQQARGRGTQAPKSALNTAIEDDAERASARACGTRGRRKAWRGAARGAVCLAEGVHVGA